MFEPRIKISENPAKVTNPGIKQVFRFYDDETGKALADLIALADEDFSSGEPLTIFHPEHTWKRTTLEHYHARPLLVPIFEGGRQVYESPKLSEIAAYAQSELGTFWEEYKRLNNPQRYKVDLSQRLYDLKTGLLAQRSR